MLAVQESETVCELGVEPVPDTAIEGGVVALQLTVTVPLALPPVVGAKVTFNVVDCVGVSTVPGATPLALNSAPDTVTLEMVMVELPVFVRVTPSVLLLVTVTAPKSRLVGLAVRMNVAATPVPDSGTAVGEVGALLVMEILPLALPVADGANTALNDTVAPAATVCAASPCTLKPAPVTVTCEMTRFAVPVFFRLIGCELLVPTTTLPKLTGDGVTEIPGWAAAVPVPESGTAVGEVGALLVMEMLPLALPVADGAKTALNDTLAPAASVCAASPCTLNPVPVTVT